MTWIIKLLTSSIGRKLIMSLTGLFLCTFLIVHLIGNISLVYNDNGETFNAYAHFMTTNPLIWALSFGLYALILLHTFQGLLLWYSNRKAKSTKYAVSTSDNASLASKNMALLGTLILVFLCIHMGDFWWKMKFGPIGTVPIEGYDYEVKDLYTRVHTAFSQLWIVVIYVLGMIALFFHLSHGFASAFQTLGIQHKKYTPIIKGIGITYAFVIPFCFALIPLYIYFK